MEVTQLTPYIFRGNAVKCFPLQLTEQTDEKELFNSTIAQKIAEKTITYCKIIFKLTL